MRTCRSCSSTVSKASAFANSPGSCSMREAAGKDIACLLEGWRDDEEEEEQ